MKILKKFGSFINEDLENNMPIESPMGAPVEPKTSTIVDETEEEEEDKYGKMLKDLAKSLGTEVVKDDKSGALCVKYEGKTINVYSEDDKYHVDKKKFTTVDEVVSYLNGGKPMSKQEFNNEVEDMEDDLEDMSDDLEEIEEEDEMLEEGWRDDMDMNPEYFDDEEDDFDDDLSDVEEFDDEWVEEEEFNDEDESSVHTVCPSCNCKNCECAEFNDEESLTGEMEGERRMGMDESRITKRFKDFK